MKNIREEGGNILFSFTNDDATAIDATPFSRTDADAKWFNIAGQNVDASAKGLVIKKLSDGTVYKMIK